MAAIWPARSRAASSANPVRYMVCGPVALWSIGPGSRRGRAATRMECYAFVNEADMSAIFTSLTVFLKVEFLMRSLSMRS